MKIVLINPKSPWADEPAMNPPLGLGYLASYLKAGGFPDVNIVDLDLFFVTIPLDADVYGIGCMTPQYKGAVEICDYIRKHNPSAKIIVGGPHFTSMPQDKPDSANVAIRGEAETALLMYLKGGQVNMGEIHRIDDLDNKPHPVRLGMKYYHRTLEGKPAAHVVTLRGCPFNCSFCDRTSVSRVLRTRSVANVMEELHSLNAEYGIRHFVFYDDIFTLLPDRVFEFCMELSNAAYGWRCWSRADTLNENMLREMSRSGLVSITLGIESGDDDVLKKIDKKITAEINKQALNWCKELGIPVRCSLMYGNPGESKESIDNTIRLIEETQPDEWNLARLVPMPGSPIWENPDEYGIEIDYAGLKADQYQGMDRFGATGVGRVDGDGGLVYFAHELERVCPRKNIQDTIQNINFEKTEAV